MKSYSIEEVLPHDHPMILIDQIGYYDETKAVCSVTITPNSQFYSEGEQGVPSYVGIEYMAQSIAAYANANELSEGKQVEIGFLVSTRKYKSTKSLFENQSQLSIHVEKLYKDESGLSAFDCEIIEGDESVASARINVFQPNNPEEFLAQQA